MWLEDVIASSSCSKSKASVHHLQFQAPHLESIAFQRLERSLLKTDRRALFEQRWVVILANPAVMRPLLVFSFILILL